MTQAETQGRLERLLSYLEHDPDNVPLLRDAAQAAMDADSLGQAKDLFGRLRDAGELSDADSNSWAIAAMRSGEPKLAAETFAGLLEASPDNQALRFNLAWARALAKDNVGARELLDDTLADELPQAAMLQVQLMHEAGEFEEAAKRGRVLVGRHGDYPPLLAAVSVLALDVEDEDLARDCATRAGGHPDALTTLAMLALGNAESERARGMFEQSLAINSHSPRAWLGLGLSDLVAGNAMAAGPSIDKGAELFGDHVESWIAAGWAYLIAGDLAKASERFEQGLALDDTFSEGHGSLAVIDALRGDQNAGAARVERALQLDAECFSAALAKMMMATSEGDAEKGRRIFERALRQPIGQSNLTIAHMIARMAR